MDTNGLTGFRTRGVLPNGVRVVCERIPSLKSVAVGAYVTTGTRYENRTNNGICHFLEHLAFKGTPQRNYLQLARDMDSVGGDFDAYTSHETTCYSASVLAEDLSFTLDLISDLVVRSHFPDPEVEKERGVVLEEIRSVEDDPKEFVADQVYEMVFAGHPLGRPVLGTRETVGGLEREQILAFRDSHYTGDNLVLSAAGNVEFGDLMGLAETYFSGIPARSPAERDFYPPVVSSGVRFVRRDLEQVHFCLGIPGLPWDSEDRYSAFLLNSILGGNFSSRLFQKIREEHGLCYSIHSYLNFHKDTGLLGIYGATSPDTFPRVLELTVGELDRIRTEPVRRDELDRVKNQFRRNLILSLEDSAHRMGQLARQEMYLGRFVSLDEMMGEMNRVTPEGILELAADLIDERVYNLVVMGETAETEKRDLPELMGGGAISRF